MKKQGNQCRINGFKIQLLIHEEILSKSWNRRELPKHDIKVTHKKPS